MTATTPTGQPCPIESIPTSELMHDYIEACVDARLCAAALVSSPGERMREYEQRLRGNHAAVAKIANEFNRRLMDDGRASDAKAEIFRLLHDAGASPILISAILQILGRVTQELAAVRVGRDRLLADYRKVKGEKVKRATGKVKWFNRIKGYGFITPDGGEEEVFVHYSAIDMDGYRKLDEGDRVTFEVVDKGRGPQAQGVKVER
jgi:cold shock protein